MEIARANILANALFNEFQKKNPISEAEMKAMMGSMMPGLGNLFS
jgi:hypothetical protein